MSHFCGESTQQGNLAANPAGELHCRCSGIPRARRYEGLSRTSGRHSTSRRGEGTVSGSGLESLIVLLGRTTAVLGALSPSPWQKPGSMSRKHAARFSSCGFLPVLTLWLLLLPPPPPPPLLLLLLLLLAWGAWFDDKIRAAVHPSRSQPRPVEDVRPLRLLQGGHVRPDGRGGGRVPDQAHELPFPLPRLQGRPPLVQVRPFASCFCGCLRRTGLASRHAFCNVSYS